MSSAPGPSYASGDTRSAESGWEDDGGRSPQERLDTSHQSNTRGEHRYSDLHQTPAEQLARRQRDELKQRMAMRPPARA